MKRVLVFYYSQSGQVRRAMESLTHPLQAAREIQVQVREIRPQVPYPFPWRRITAFFGVMPETVLGPPGFNLPLENGDQAEQPSADLVILAYPVWFLMPAPPVQRFLIDDAPRTMHGSRVVALCVCRGMWYHAARAVQQALQQLRCTNWSQVVVTHQGPQWATFLSVPRQMLFGSEGRLLPGLPPVGLSASELSAAGPHRRMVTQFAQRSTIQLHAWDARCHARRVAALVDPARAVRVAVLLLFRRGDAISGPLLSSVT